MPEHDKLAVRLSAILYKLNSGEVLAPASLADEFCVDVRTIQRDLNQRFAYLPIIREEGKYRLDSAYLGKFGSRDIERFASISGVQGLFPTLGMEFLRELFQERFGDAVQVSGHHYEDVSSRSADFRLIREAIKDACLIEFRYSKVDGSDRIRTISPYRLINEKGIWYLAGTDAGVLKWFSLSRVSGIGKLSRSFAPDRAVLAQLDAANGAWPGPTLVRVELLVETPAADYFRRRPIFPNQTITRSHDDGSLSVVCEVAHPAQLLPLIRYWIPHVRVVAPGSVRNELVDSLRKYLQI